MPPNVGSSSADDLDEVVDILVVQLDVEDVDVGELLEEHALPSITGLEASAPRSAAWA